MRFGICQHKKAVWKVLHQTDGKDPEKTQGFIKGFQPDIRAVAAHPLPEEGCCGMEVNGTRFTEKAEAGEAILAVCKANQDFSGRLFFLAAIFPFSNEKACLGVIAKTDFFYRLSGAESLLCAAVCFIHCINPLHAICSFALSE